MMKRDKTGSTWLAVGFALATVLAVWLGAAPVAAQQHAPPSIPSLGPPPKPGQSAVAPTVNAARTELFISGSSTMAPYVTATVKALKEHYDAFPPPKAHLEGSKIGIAEFCSGIGAEYPDIAVSSRGMHKDEFDRCIENGVLDVIEIKIGLSAYFVVAPKGGTVFNVTPRMFYNALAALIPRKEDEVVTDLDVKGKAAVPKPAPATGTKMPPLQAVKKGEFDDNPNTSWQQVDKSAPDLPIRVILASETSGTRNTFDALFMQGGCRRVKEIDLIYSADERMQKCVTLRTDGVVTEVDEPYGPRMVELLLKSPPGTIAVMTGEVYRTFRDKLETLPVNGILPTDAAIARFDYVMATGNFFYFKRGHMLSNAGVGVVRGIREFMVELTHDDMMGRKGSFIELGLVPVTDRELLAEQRKVRTLQRFTR